MKQITIFRKFTQVIGSRTLPEILKAIQQGVYREEVLAVRRAVQRGDQKIANETKKQLHAFTISGRFEGGRTMAHLKEYHPFMILDIDKLDMMNLERVVKVVQELPYTHASFISPSGNGCKIIVKVNSKMTHHLSAYLQVAEFYEKKLRLKIDKSGKDITRLCFFSFDENLFSNPKSKAFVVKDTIVKSLPFETKKKMEQPSNVFPLPKNMETNSNNDSRLKSCLAFTKKKQQYVEGNRNNFIYLFASNCNREGISESEVLNFAKQEFNLPIGELQSSIRSAFHHHSIEHGKKSRKVSKKKQSKQYQHLDAQELFYEQMMTTPCFPKKVYQQLPQLLKKCCEVFESEREKDVFLTGALGILSGSLTEMEGTYDGRTEFSNLFTFIIAPPANGKGAMKYAAMLGDAFHQKLAEERQESLAQYRVEMTEYRSAVRDFSKGKRNEFPEEPEVPDLKLFFIPANSSSAMVIKHLQESDGVGVICETEADTLGNVLKQDWGGFSDLLRKAFHFESISYSRKSNDEYIEIRAPRLSVVLSGTPGQIFKLIPSAEDGLYSRFCFYAFNSGLNWRDVSVTNKQDLKIFFEEKSKKVLTMIEFWKAHPAKFSLSKNQWKDLNQHFEKLLHQTGAFERWEALSIVKRMALILFRIAMLLTAIRRFENQDWGEELICKEEDYQTAKSLVEVYRVHGFFLFGMLGKAKGVNYQRLPNRKKQFFEKLPERFQRKEAIEIGKSLGLSRTSIDRWLKQMTEDYLEQSEYGMYQKIKNEKVGKVV
ncbi:MAG: DUF3987 domain-containing protein [Saprospiraceae bacterium]